MPSPSIQITAIETAPGATRKLLDAGAAVSTASYTRLMN